MAQNHDATEAFRGRSVVSTADFSKDEILALLDAARAFDRYHDGPVWTPQPPELQGRVLGTLFFEASTRTRLSFESAMNLDSSANTFFLRRHGYAGLGLNFEISN